MTRMLAGLLLVLLQFPAPSRASGVALSLTAPESEVDQRAVRSRLYWSDVDADALQVRSAYVALLGEDRLGVFGGLATEGCPRSEPMEAEDFRRRLEQAADSLAFADYELARGALLELDRALPCLGEALPLELLHQLRLHLGVASWYAGDRSAAFDVFRDAVVLNSDYSWGGEFGPGPQETHVQAQRAVLRDGRAQLQLAFGEADARLWLDGEELVLKEGWVSLDLLVGSHWLVLESGSEERRGYRLELRSDGVIADLAALELGLNRLVDGSSRGIAGAALMALSHWSTDAGHAELWLVRTRPDQREASTEGRHRGPRVVRIDPLARRLRPAGSARERMNAMPWRLSVAAEGGYMMLAREGGDFDYGTFDLGIWFSALPLLRVGLSLGFSVTGFPVDAYLVLPVRVRLRVAPDFGPWRPYGGLAATSLWLGERPSGPQFAFGGEVEGGLGWRPMQDRLLGVQVGVAAGYVGGLVLRAGLGVSLTW
jgi:hypothetical protein